MAIEVSNAGDVLEASSAARIFAASLHFSPQACDEVSLVVTELATNLVRHASGGVISIAPVSAADRTGIEVRSVDKGPGIRDVEAAIADGYSSVGGLGIGLGTINRLVDDFEITSGDEGGLDVVCRRWLRPESEGTARHRLTLGVATRPYRQMKENGDTFVFKQWGDHALAGVIDGLGHGPLAQRAAQAARRYVEQHFDQPMVSLFRGACRACRATRGVVMALAQFDLRQRTVTIGSVGNIEVRLVGSPEKFSLFVRRGIVGLNAPNPVPRAHPWTPETTLIMHSDGLRTHWDWKEFPGLEKESPSAVARQLLTKLGKTDDDATVIVVRSAGA